MRGAPAGAISTRQRPSAPASAATAKPRLASTARSGAGSNGATTSSTPVGGRPASAAPIAAHGSTPPARMGAASSWTEWARALGLRRHGRCGRGRRRAARPGAIEPDRDIGPSLAASGSERAPSSQRRMRPCSMPTKSVAITSASRRASRAPSRCARRTSSATSAACRATVWRSASRRRPSPVAAENRRRGRPGSRSAYASSASPSASSCASAGRSPSTIAGTTRCASSSRACATTARSSASLDPGSDGRARAA